MKPATSGAAATTTRCCSSTSTASSWVNDSLGHAAGDRLLVEIARAARGRSSRGEALIARYGGDEFTLLPDGACDRERAVRIAERVLRCSSGPFDIGGQQVFSGASVGIVLGRADYDSPDQVLRDADTAMYRAKAGGKSGYVVFDEAMHAAARMRLQLETDFRLALEREEFRRCTTSRSWRWRTARIVGVEALVRWQHPQRGLLLPARVPARRGGDRPDRRARLVGAARRPARSWRRGAAVSRSTPRCVINVNVDERQMASPELSQRGRRAARAHAAAAPRSLRWRSPRRVFRAGRGQAGETLRALKALGVGLVGRRLRHRLFVARGVRGVAVRRAQDRPRVRARHGDQPRATARSCARSPASPTTSACAHRRRHRDRGPARDAARSSAAVTARASCSRRALPAGRIRAAALRVRASTRRAELHATTSTVAC